jgi:hypothetical protein
MEALCNSPVNYNDFRFFAVERWKTSVAAPASDISFLFRST